MNKIERVAWMLVQAVPQGLARWLMFSKLGQRVPLPRSWPPYLFGRALGVDGSKCPIRPTDVSKLSLMPTEAPTEHAA